MIRKLMVLVMAAMLLLATAGARGETYYLNYTNGSDANAGTSAALPWKNISKVNTTLAAVTTATRVIIDTHSGPQYMDEQLVGHDRLQFVGIGNNSFVNCQGLTIRGCAELRPWKLIAANSWTLTSGKTRTYETTDTVATAMVYKYVGWSSTVTQPLTRLAHIDGASYAAVAATLDATAGNWFTDGTKMYVSSATNPASDGSSYARSTPNLMTSAAFGTLDTRGDVTGGKNPIVLFDNSSASHIICGGGAAMNPAGTTVIAYTFLLSPGPSASPSLDNSLAYGGAYHTLGVLYNTVNGATGGVATGTTRLTDVRWEGGMTNDTISGILFFDGTTSNKIIMTRCRSDYSNTLVGSTEGDPAGDNQVLGGHGGGTPGISSLVMTDCQMAASPTTGTYTQRKALLIGDTVLGPNSLQISGGWYGMIYCYVSTSYTNVNLTCGLPTSEFAVAGLTQTLRNCRYVPRWTGTNWVGTWAVAHGTYDIQHCYIDMSQAPWGFFAHHGGLMVYDAGSLTLTFKNNVVKLRGSDGYDVSILYNITALNQAGLTITMDYNAHATTLASGSTSLIQMDQDNVLVTDATAAGLGYGAHSLFYTSTLGFEKLVESNGVVLPESPLISAGDNGVPMGPYASTAWVGINPPHAP